MIVSQHIIGFVTNQLVRSNWAAFQKQTPYGKMNDITLDTCLHRVAHLLDILVVTGYPVYLQRRVVIFRTEQNKVANVEQKLASVVSPNWMTNPKIIQKNQKIKK